ncbi:MAG: hypothetical protein ACK5CY_01515 [Bacteroidia bacterium]|jgi:hypothetical protein
MGSQLKFSEKRGIGIKQNQNEEKKVEAFDIRQVYSKNLIVDYTASLVLSKLALIVVFTFFNYPPIG